MTPAPSPRSAGETLRTYELMTNSITDAVSAVDADLRYLLVNDAWCRMTGRSRQDVIGRTPSEVLTAIDNTERSQVMRACLDTQQVRVVRDELRFARGPSMRVETTYTPYADSAGAAPARWVVMVTRNISEEARAIENMRRSEASQRALLEAFPGFISQLDENLVYTYVNQRQADRFGLAPHALVGRKLMDVVGQETGIWLWGHFTRLLNGEEVTFEHRHASDDGFGRYDQVTLALGLDAQTGRRVIYSFGVDITERKRTEEHLAATSAQLTRRTQELQLTLESIDQGIVSYDGDGRVGIHNSQALSLMDLPPKLFDELKTYDEVVRYQVQRGDLARDASFTDVYGQHQYFKGGRANSPDLYIRRSAKGTVIEVRTRHLPHGAIVRTYADVTSYFEAQHALIAARDAAESASRAKSEFLSRMTHELRTPMNAILGFGQLLELEGQSAPDRREWGREVVKGGRHLLELINEVLDLARVESGKIAMRLEPLALGPVVEDCMALLGPQAGARGIRMRAQLPATSLRVQADRVRLKQALLNLLANAVKYNSEGGSVDIACEAEALGSCARVSVSDTGQGLTPAQLGRLFQPFERLDANLEHIEGTGIGLVLTRRFVELMHGEMGVDSSPGQGSRFWFTLPLAD